MPNRPNWVNRHKQWKEWWDKPWTIPQRSDRAVKFKLRLWNHGLLTPNFSRREASGKWRNSRGCDVPARLRKNAQFHAVGLERVRHDCGNKTMSPLSWYRCGPHNSDVGGVSDSQHLNAWATDWSDVTRARLGGARFDNSMHKHFANGGRGVLGGSRHIRHVDNGPARTWSY